MLQFFFPRSKPNEITATSDANSASTTLQVNDSWEITVSLNPETVFPGDNLACKILVYYKQSRKGGLQETSSQQNDNNNESELNTDEGWSIARNQINDKINFESLGGNITSEITIPGLKHHEQEFLLNHNYPHFNLYHSKYPFSMGLTNNYKPSSPTIQTFYFPNQKVFFDEVTSSAQYDTLKNGNNNDDEIASKMNNLSVTLQNNSWNRNSNQQIISSDSESDSNIVQQRSQTRTMPTYPTSKTRSSPVPTSKAVPASPRTSDTKEPQLNFISVQVWGRLVIEPSWIKTPLPPSVKFDFQLPTPVQPATYDQASIYDPTSHFGENTRGIFSSGVTIVDSDIKLPPGACKQYVVRTSIPYNLPPSFKGTGLKYQYYLTVNAEHSSPMKPDQSNATNKTIHIPIRVLNPSLALSEEQRPSSPSPSRQANLASSQLISEHDMNNAMRMIQTLCEEKSYSVSMNINIAQTHLLKLSLNKSVHQLGDPIRGFFDFTGAEKKTYQVSVRLEVEEQIDQNIMNPIRGKKPVYKIVAEHHELTHNTHQSYFDFHIPIDMPPEFVTSLVSVRWVLRFEFIVGTSKIDQTSPQRNHWETKHEALSWVYPLRVFVPERPPEQIYKILNQISF